MSQAEDLGITAGKLALITAYNDYENTTRTQEELMNMSIYDIISSIEDQEGFFEDENVHRTVDTISGASAEGNNDESENDENVDTVSGASEDTGNGDSFVDTTTGASADT